ncbi:MAG: Rrf2 family transcriptional regulator [Candidatus Omnitrophica bacterium]|nr:Rrf2 family transcriptional regulator [Candidatus Omnitrophota bacterium]MCK5260345.1 Rrf2 family transcriptional regulator [Candidatus Omnitrophota bacterium]
MFKINKKIEYALIALKHMSNKSPGQLTSAKKICELYHTPFDPTSRVLQIMAQNSILNAEQGAKGGYQIIKDLSKISTRELSDMIIGPIKITNCAHADFSQCNISSKCLISSAMVNLNESIQNLFSAIMVADLIDSTAKCK